MQTKITSAFSTGILMLIFSLTALSQGNRLLAPFPPDAILYGEGSAPTEDNLPERGFTVSLYSPMPVDEVVEFYRQQIGELEAIESGNHYHAELLPVHVEALGILKVYDIPDKPGVSVRSIRTEESRNCTSEYFRPFREMHRELEQYDRSDFNELCGRYGYLEHAFFGFSERVMADGRHMTRDEKLHRQYQGELDPEAGEAIDAEDLMEEAQQLMAQGRMEEAAALMEKIAASQGQAAQRNIERMQQGERKQVGDQWDEWLEFLKELEKLAYPTIVYIDYHPSYWPDDDWLHESIKW